MNILELGNPDSGAFRVRLLRRGEPYGPHHELVYDRDAPVLEFYGPALADEQPGEAKLLGRYAASRFLHSRQGWTRVGDGYGVSPANARDIAAWLERELSNPWTPPSGPKPEAQVITDRPVRLHQAGERRATIYVRGDEGYRKEEAEWVEVSRRPDGQYVIGYLPRPGQRDKYGRRRRIGHQALEMVFPSRPPIIVFLGWDHPDLQTQMPPEEHSSQWGQQTLSYTLIEGVSIESRESRERPENVAKRLGLQQMFDSELDRYLATYPLTHILLDLREPSPEGTEPAAPSDQLILDATGGKDLDAEVTQAASHAPSVFVSYHHGGDAAARDRFERENRSIIRSSSIYPGEISSGPEVRREIRKRIVGCHYVVVLVGRETYTRRWVDWEIHAALTRDRGGAPRPVVGILLPEMSTLGALLQSPLVKPSPRTTAGELLRLSDELSRELVAETGATLPARLLDNLLTGYVILVPWPASQTALLDALAASVGRARPVNGRRLLRQNLPMTPSGPPVTGPEPEPAEAPQRELVTITGPGGFPAEDRSAWLVSALQSYGPEEVLAALGAKGDAESAKLAAALRRHAHVLEPLDSGTSMAATLMTRLVAGDALSAMRNGLTAAIHGPHLAVTAQLPDVTPGTLKRILARLTKAGFRSQRIVADPNGGWIATGSEGLIEVWEAFEGRRLHRFDGMWGEVDDLIVDRNGNWLAATDEINFVRVWSIPSGELLLEKFAGQYGTGVLAADTAGRWLAAGGARDVSVWDIGTGARLHKLDTGGIRPRVLIFGPQGQWLCCVGDGLRKIRIWSMPAGDPARDLIDRTKDFWIQYLAVDPAGRWLATAGRGAVRVWDIDTGERLHALVPPGGSLEAFEVGPQAQWLYCAGSSGAVRLSPTPAGQPAAKPANRSKAKNKWAELFVDAAGRELMSSVQAGRWVTRQHISIWDPAAPPPPSRYFPQFLGPVTALTADTAGSWYSYAIEGDDAIRVHDVSTGTEQKMTAASSGSPGQGPAPRCRPIPMAPGWPQPLMTASCGSGIPGTGQSGSSSPVGCGKPQPTSASGSPRRPAGAG